MSKQAVQISILSRQEDGGQSEMTTQTHCGTLFRRIEHTYLVYAEEGMSTTMRFSARELHLYRRGLLNSWQEFQPDAETRGLLTLGVNDLPLRVVTTFFHIEQASHHGRIQLGYELWSDDTAERDPDGLEVSLGKFTLSVSWEVLPISEENAEAPSSEL